MAENTAVVAIYNSHTEAEASIKELQRSGFDMKKLSIVGKDYHTEEHVVGYYNAGDRMKVWGKLGAFWGGFLGLTVRVSGACSKSEMAPLSKECRLVRGFTNRDSAETVRQKVRIVFSQVQQRGDHDAPAT
jgi:hypothetical protein